VSLSASAAPGKQFKYRDKLTSLACHRYRVNTLILEFQVYSITGVVFVKRRVFVIKIGLTFIHISRVLVVHNIT